MPFSWSRVHDMLLFTSGILSYLQQIRQRFADYAVLSVIWFCMHVSCKGTLLSFELPVNHHSSAGHKNDSDQHLLIITNLYNVNWLR